MSPELLDPESFGLTKIRPTKESDCYALGMVVYEVLSGQTPFFPSGPAVVIRKVLGGERPEKPQEEKGGLFTDTIWGVLGYCWKSWPHERINAEAILLGLEGNPLALRPPNNMEGDEETDTDDRSDTTESDSGISSQVYPLFISDHPCTIIGLPGSPREGGIVDKWTRTAGKIFKDVAGELRKLWRIIQ